MHGLRLLSETVPKVTGKVFNRKYTMLGRLVTHWRDIVGEEMAAKTQPVKIRYLKHRTKRGKATASLDIAATSADSTVLHYQKDLIIERINQIFGDKWITAIRFVPQPANQQVQPKPRPEPLSDSEKGKLENMLDSIPDSDLKEKLKNLGTAILQNRSS